MIHALIQVVGIFILKQIPKNVMTAIQYLVMVAQAIVQQNLAIIVSYIFFTDLQFVANVHQIARNVLALQLKTVLNAQKKIHKDQISLVNSYYAEMVLQILVKAVMMETFCQVIVVQIYAKLKQIFITARIIQLLYLKLLANLVKPNAKFVQVQLMIIALSVWIQLKDSKMIQFAIKQNVETVL